MAVSELHSRLEHLVTYSSQLIFISGDTIGDQQRSLQTFLAQQNENAELAFVNAEPEGSVQQYRKQINLQLMGDDSGLYNRPLNELLAPLNHHEGPVLICICQAECIPPSFLQELWDLVLQSRFANNKQHLNVLLFGKSQWAEQAKAWLPAKNRDKPLLLSTESIHQAQSIPSELDQLIADKRRKFAERIEKRNQSFEPEVAPLSTWWFKSLLTFVFLLAFSGIMIWQYSDQFSPYVDSVTEMALTTEPDVDLPPAQPQQTVDKQSTTPTVNESIANSTASEGFIPDYVQLEPDVQETATQATPETTKAKITSIIEGAPVKQQRVTDWQTAISRYHQNKDKEESSDELNNSELSSEPVQVTEVAASGIPPQALISEEPVVVEDELQPMDYQVDDIVAVEQIADAPNQQIDSNEKLDTSLPTIETSTLPAEINSQPNVTDDEQALLDLVDSLFVIQVAGMTDKQVLEEYISDNQLQNDVWIYTTQRYGGDWYVLIYKDSYASLDSARNASTTLPAVLQQGTPFAKTVKQVHQEISTLE